MHALTSSPCSQCEQVNPLLFAIHYCCVCECQHACAMVCMWRSEDNFWEGFFLSIMGFGTSTQSVGSDSISTPEISCCPSPKTYLFFNAYVCVSVFVYVYHLYVVACRGQKRVLDSLEQELQMVVSYLMFEMGTEPGSSERAASTQLLSRISCHGSPLPLFFSLEVRCSVISVFSF